MSRESMLATLTPDWQRRFQGTDLTPSRVADLAGQSRPHVISIMRGWTVRPGQEILEAIDDVFERTCPTCKRYWPEKIGAKGKPAKSSR
jgi:hypothetical protein